MNSHAKSIGKKHVFALALALGTLVNASLAIAEPTPFRKVASDTRVEDSLGACAGLANNDYLACPIIKTYQLKKFNTDTVLWFLTEKNGYEPVQSKGIEARNVIRDSLSGQINAVLECGEDCGIDSPEALAQAARDTIRAIGKFLAIADRNKFTIYVDENTYWAPSVNARAVFVLNPIRKTVTIIMHGDTDG